MVLYILLGIAFVLACSCEHIIQTRYDFRTLTRFPVYFFSPELNRNITGYASLDLSEELIGFTSSSDSFDEISVSQIFFANVVLPYRYRVPLDWNEEFKPTAHINADMSSGLLRQVGSYLLTPISESEGLIVLTPDNPNAYAYNGELFYSPCVHQDVLQVMTAVQVVLASNRNESPLPVASSQFLRCSIITGNHDDEDDDDDDSYQGNELIWIPPFAWEILSHELERNGLIYSRDREIGNVYGSPILVDRVRAESVMDSLPSIRFLVELTDGSQASVFVIEPREYFASNRMHSNDEPYLMLNVFSSHVPFCELGKRFLKKTVIHVDGRTHQIGFGDPLIEI